MKDHLFVASGAGDLFDTRLPDWSKLAPLRAGFRCHHRDIETVSELKATLRAGAYAWPGGYPLYLICSDGAALCFKCAKKETRNIFESIANKSRDGWRVVGCDINHEDNDLTCDHCSKDIDSSIGKD